MGAPNIPLHPGLNGPSIDPIHIGSTRTRLVTSKYFLVGKDPGSVERSQQQEAKAEVENVTIPT